MSIQAGWVERTATYGPECAKVACDGGRIELAVCEVGCAESGECVCGPAGICLDARGTGEGVSGGGEGAAGEGG